MLFLRKPAGISNGAEDLSQTPSAWRVITEIWFEFTLIRTRFEGNAAGTHQ